MIMGMVFQHLALFPHRTVLENVAFPLEVRGVERAEREARAAEIIKLVTLEGRENFFHRELGVGGTVGEIDIDAGIGEPPRRVGQRAGAILNLDRHHLTNLADGKARRL